MKKWMTFTHNGDILLRRHSTEADRPNRRSRRRQESGHEPPLISKKLNIARKRFDLYHYLFIFIVNFVPRHKT
jgi:hypothetical protein